MPSGAFTLLAALAVARGLRAWFVPADGAWPPIAPDESSMTEAAAVEPSESETTEETVSGPPLVTDLAEALADTPELEIPTHPTWVRHRIRPGERITQIAARYGAKWADVVRINKLDATAIKPPKGRRHVRVRAHRIPAPRRLVRYRATSGQTWDDIAAVFRVEIPDLRNWNWHVANPKAGDELQLWVDPANRSMLEPDTGPAIPERIEVTPGGRSRGKPQHGSLEAGVLLPESPNYKRRKPTHGLHGSSHTIEQVVRAFATFRHDSGFDGEIVIVGISRKHGGPFSPHVSHQSGRDLDIRLPARPGVPDPRAPNPDEIDWDATWALVEAFVATGEVEVVLLDETLHRRLYEAGRAAGRSAEETYAVVRWPIWRGSGDPVVRHADQHLEHIHVRIRCGPAEPKCRS